MLVVGGLCAQQLVSDSLVTHGAEDICFACWLINWWIPYVCQAWDMDGIVCGNVTFGAWRLWHHKFCHLFGSPRKHAQSCSRLVRCTVANCRHIMYDVGGWASRSTPLQARRVRCDTPRVVGQAFSFKLASRMFRFATLITPHVTLCVIRYNHLATKLGPDVEELKFSHCYVLWYPILKFVNDVQLIKHRLISLIVSTSAIHCLERITYYGT